MSAAKQRILLLGDYSNCHATLAMGLRKLGCDVTIASDGTAWMDTDRDIDITRRPGKIGGLLHYLKMLRLLRGRLSGFDIVAVNDPNFCYVRPIRLKKLLDILLRRNGAVFLTAMSTDIAFLDMLAAPDCPVRYSEWFVDGKPSRMYMANPDEWTKWHNPELTDYQNYFFDNIDGAVSVLYEYHLGMVRRLGSEKAAYGGIPIVTEQYEPVAMSANIGKVKIFLGRDRTRKLMKGSDYLEAAARRVVERHPDAAELEIVENVPFAEFKRRLRNSHVVLDQIYSYTPATTALMAMSYGLVCVSGAEPEFYDFIGERANRPVVNAPIDLDALTGTIEQLVLEKSSLAERGRQSRRFVEHHNDSLVVAQRFLDFWNRRIEQKGVRKC